MKLSSHATQILHELGLSTSLYSGLTLQLYILVADVFVDSLS